eukprot:4934678-Pleurochrysis_carterae.AAC.1
MPKVNASRSDAAACCRPCTRPALVAAFTHTIRMLASVLPLPRFFLRFSDIVPSILSSLQLLIPSPYKT